MQLHLSQTLSPESNHHSAAKISHPITFPVLADPIFFLGYKHAKALLKQLELTITAASEQTLADYINKKMGEPADKLKKVAKTKLCKDQPANTWAAL